MSRFLCIICLVFNFSFVVLGQLDKSLALQIATSTPDNIRTSTELSKYWLSKTDSIEGYYAVAYAWVATHIRYDVAQVKNPLMLPGNELAKRACNQRKAVCSGYANLLVSLLADAHIQSYVIEGYTKKGETLKDESHAWVLVNIREHWMFCEPTWGAGYVNDEKFTPLFTWNWFNISPFEFIKTHLPFDVVWQAMPSIVLPKCFVKPSCNFTDTLVYACIDTIRNLSKKAEIEQLESVLRRVDEYAVRNSSTLKYRYVLAHNIEVLKLNRDVTLRNEVAAKLNVLIKSTQQASELLNRYYGLKSKKQEKTEKATLYLKQANEIVEKSSTQYNEIENISPDLKENARMLRKTLTELETMITKELDH